MTQILAEHLTLLGELIDETADKIALSPDDSYELTDTPANLAFVQGAEAHRYGAKGGAECSRNGGLIYTSRSLLLDYVAHLLEAESVWPSRNDHVMLDCPNCQQTYEAVLGNNPLVRDGLTVTPAPPPQFACRRCVGCEGEEHHWMVECDDARPEGVMACRHCPAVRPITDADLEDFEDED